MTIQFDGVTSYVSVTPIKATFTDTVDSTRLYVRSTLDNLTDSASFHWELRDDSGNLHFQGNVTICEDAYTTWTGASDYVFTYIASIKGLTIVEEV